ncbi:MAG: biopolymer transporter ExbD [Cytophagaceae bacterium]|jgi:biopolymer transport protein ExbD|nr:biopolymer transporter ExbD [Cytophagaceae bacterium]
MKIQRKNRISTQFEMSSMTDLIFLLLIFFLLTSNFVTPSGLPINLPTTKPTPMSDKEKIRISISEDLRYYINDNPSSLEKIETTFQSRAKENKENTVVVMDVDEMVPVKYFVKVAGLANHYGLKVSLSTKPE